jgi:phage portal protein BeeE
MTNQTAALNPYVTYQETGATPDKMLLIDSADYSAKDLSRATSVPPYLVGVSTGSYAYTNATQSRIDLWTFGCLPYAKCIEETLSSDNVLPHGTKVKFDVDDFLSEMYQGGDIEEPVEPDTQAPEMPDAATRTA